MEDLLDCGVDVINLQDLVNGVDWIAEQLTGRSASISTSTGKTSPRTASPPNRRPRFAKKSRSWRQAGGLMMIYGLYPGVPLENAEAVMDAMEKYAGYYS